MKLHKSVILCTLMFSLKANAVELSIHLSETEQQVALIEKLKNNKIPFTHESSGNIRYPDKYYKDVNKWARETITNDLPENRSIQYVSTKDHISFINKLKSENISYSIKQRHNAKWIVWEEKDSYKVDKIKTLIQ